MMRMQNARWLIIVVVCGLLFVFFQSNLFATEIIEGTDSVTLPVDSAAASPFTVEVTIPDSVSSGYMPVEVIVASNSVFAADRNLVVRLEPDPTDHTTPVSSVVVEIPVVAEQGKRLVTVLKYVPKWSLGAVFTVRVFEDRRELPGFSASIGTPRKRVEGGRLGDLKNEASITWLSVNESNRFSLRELETATRDSNNNAVRSVRSRWSQPAANAPRSFHKITASQMPTDWRGLQSFDGVAIPFEILAQLPSDDQRLQALREWLYSGGTLAVGGVPSGELPENSRDWMKPSGVETSRLRQVSAELLKGLKDYRWGLLEQIKQREALASVGSVSRSGSRQQDTAELKQMRGQVTAYDALITKVEQAWDQEAHACGMGRIILYENSLESLGQYQAKVLVDSFGHRCSRMLRRGVDSVLGDTRAKRWLVPGVAQPPVYMFMGLLTVFVILVGPIAYRKTTKAGRSYLMFLIAPVLALMTTLAMFTYGILADGFGTVTRIRQVTWVDGNTGHAFERVRSTYFAGIRPSKDLSFGPDNEVFIYPDHDGASLESVSSRRFSNVGSVVVRQSSQDFSNQVLPSRTQRQFISQGPRRDFGRLVVRRAETKDPAEPWLVDSTIKKRLRSVVFRDENGVYWYIDKLKPGAQNIAAKSFEKATDLSRTLGSMYLEHRPVAEYTSRNDSSSRRNTQTRDLIGVLNRITTIRAQQSVEEGLLEKWLHQYLQLTQSLPPKSFVALADVSEDVVLVEGAEVVQSIRYVMGSLP